MIRLAVLAVLFTAATPATLPVAPSVAPSSEHTTPAHAGAPLGMPVPSPPPTPTTVAWDVVVADRWLWPVAAPHSIARPFLAPATPYAAGHRGIDVRAFDASVVAPTDGVVHFAGFVVSRPVLSIRHPGGLITSYEPVTTTLIAGDTVARGDEIGTVLPGHCATPCLHFGVRLHGEYVNPLLYLGGVPHSVLLPTR